MSITGGIKFFDISSCASQNGGTVIAGVSGNGGASNCLDRNPDTYWTSSGSNDTITETLTITLPNPTAITRLLLIDLNWKQFTVKYDVAGTPTAFTSVIGMDGSKGSISESTFADSSAYYEFSQVTTSIIYITVTTTQIMNAQKYLSLVVSTTELGTLVGYPSVESITVSKNSRVTQTLSGKYIVMKSIETASFALKFKDYPRSSVYNADMDLMMSLHDRLNPFYVWICGGRRGTNYFGYTLRGFRLKDLYYMQVTKALDLSYRSNIYQNQLNAVVQLDEHI